MPITIRQAFASEKFKPVTEIFQDDKNKKR